MLTELSPDIIDHLLNNQYFGRIGCSADNRVLIVPVMFYFDGQHLYGITREGTKIQMLRKNPNVAFEIDEMISPGLWYSVVIEGEFEELHGEERQSAVYLLKDRKIPVFVDETTLLAGDIAANHPKFIAPVVYRIHIKSKTGRCYRQ